MQNDVMLADQGEKLSMAHESVVLANVQAENTVPHG